MSNWRKDAQLQEVDVPLVVTMNADLNACWEDQTEAGDVDTIRFGPDKITFQGR
jgi:hypothetical protein